MTSRRDFLKKSCGFCIALGGIGIIASSLESCATVPMVKAKATDNKVFVSVSAFIENKAFVMVRVPSLENDILLVKKTDGTFTGLYMQCTHQAQPLSVSGNGLHCSAHGSSFDLDGNVMQEPATKPLKKYTATLSGEQIQIDLK